MIHQPSSLISKIFSLGGVYTNAWCRPQEHGPTLTAIKSVRDVDEDSARTLSETFIASTSIDRDGSLNHIPQLSMPVVKSIITDVSLSGKIFSVTSNKDGNMMVELNSPEYDFKVDASSYHGKILGDIWFGGVSWSHDERYVAYVARSKESKLTTTFENDFTDSCQVNPSDSSSTTTATTTTFKKSKFDYKEDWGERFDGVCDLVIAILDTTTGRIITLNLDENDSTIGCPVFHPQSYKLIYTYWASTPKRLGVVYCHQRPCSLHMIDLSSLLSPSSSTTVTSSTITTSSYAIKSLSPISLTSSLNIGRLGRFTPNGSHLIILGKKILPTTHVYCYELYKLNLSTLEVDQTNKDINSCVPEVLVPVVHTPADRQSFPGLFVDFIPYRCFLDNDHMLLTSTWYSTDSILCINVNNGQVTRMNELIRHGFYSENTDNTSNEWNNSQNASYSLLEVIPSPNINTPISTSSSATMKSYMVCTSSTPLSPQKIALFEISTNNLSTPNDSQNSNSGSGSSSSKVTVNRVWKSPWSHKPRFITVSSKIQLSATTTGGGSSAVSSSTPSPHGQTVSSSSIQKAFMDIQQDIISKINTMKWKIVEFYAVDDSKPIDISILNSNKKNDSDEHPSERKGSSDIENNNSKKKDNGRRYEGILILPPHDSHDEGSTAVNEKKSIPLIIVPHGGPHSCVPSIFVPSYVYLSIILNAAILHVNYRGSSGFGQTSIESLPGNIGTNDVRDMMQSLTETVVNIPKSMNRFMDIDVNQLAVIGGSHGGFLGAHMIGQYPDVFKSAVLRNPVTNIPTMTTFTDIPDWCYVEAIGLTQYNFSTFPVPSADTFIHMYQRSPIAYINQVKTPVLLCLGGHDRRVPPGQGIEYHHMLQGRHIPSKVMWFPEDTHAIDKPISETEQWIEATKWISKYFQL